MAARTRRMEASLRDWNNCLRGLPTFSSRQLMAMASAMENDTTPSMLVPSTLTTLNCVSSVITRSQKVQATLTNLSEIQSKSQKNKRGGGGGKSGGMFTADRGKDLCFFCWRAHTHTHARTQAHAHARTHTRANMHTRTHTNTHVCTRARARTHTHIHTFTHSLTVTILFSLFLLPPPPTPHPQIPPPIFVGLLFVCYFCSVLHWIGK